MKARFGHIYFTFKDSSCVYITSSRGYVKGKYAAVVMVGLGAAGVGVAALVTVIKPLWRVHCQVVSTWSYLPLLIVLQEGKEQRTEINKSRVGNCK